MIRIFIVAQSIVTQAGLAALLTLDPDLEIVGSAIRPDKIDPLQADVMLIEQDAIAQIPDSDRAIVLLLDELSGITEYLQAGVRAILPSDTSSNELIGAIKAAAIGLTVLHPEVLDFAIAPTRSIADSTTPLTAREIEVLGMLAEGLGNKAIARRLNLSEHTVKFHISSIFSKLDVSSRTEAVILGAKQGWILL